MVVRKVRDSDHMLVSGGESLSRGYGAFSESMANAVLIDVCATHICLFHDLLADNHRYQVELGSLHLGGGLT